MIISEGICKRIKKMWGHIIAHNYLDTRVEAKKTLRRIISLLLSSIVQVKCWLLEIGQVD
jgi:hypothetical protein